MTPLSRPVPGLRGACLALALVGLAGCEALPPPAGGPGATVAGPPRARPDTLGQGAAPSSDSEALARHYARVQNDLLSQGLMRLDGGGADTPFDARMLADNFIRIALYDEFTPNASGAMVARQTESRLRRWDRPIRMAVLFGASVPAERRLSDETMVGGYATRLSLLTGLPIAMTQSNANFHVLFLNEDERRAAGPLLRQLVPGIGDADVRGIVDMDRSTFCVVYAFSEGRSPVYKSAVVVIRAEHPDLLRRSCVHEELAQALGLANDSPQTRPSIFNDDEEFALLTRQDELMLKMLYDRRLTPGMTVGEARPIVETMAAELLGGGS